MDLWIYWWSLVNQLRPAFSRTSTFLWFVTAMTGLSVRADRLGVTSLVRALGLKPNMYNRLRLMFHSSAINLNALTQLWLRLVLKHCPLVKINGRLVFVGDGIKIAKEGKKMPAVKLLHQQSQSNSKPEYIMGHSCQALSLLIGSLQQCFAIPIVSRIHEGLKFSNRDRQTLLDKMLLMLNNLAVDTPFYLVVDAYYASGGFIKGLIQNGHHIISRARTNAVAYYPTKSSKKRRRGRPKVYGKKVRLADLFKNLNLFTQASSPVYGENDILVQYLTIDLIWRPLAGLVRFVLVIHPSRGRIILMSSDLSLSALDIISAYGVRFKIEVSFKQAIETLGTYAYHFWLQMMTPIRRGSGNQHLHRQTEQYRHAVKTKMAAFHAYIQAGLIAQGLLQCLSLSQSTQVWGSFGSWLRTIRTPPAPTEMVTAKALQNSLSEFLTDAKEDQIFAKFVRDRIDLSRTEGIRLIA